MTAEKNIITTVVEKRSMKDCITDFTRYSFIQAKQLPSSEWTDFGQMTSHMANGDEVKSEISLFDSTVEALYANKLNTKTVSSDQLRLSCGKHQLSIKYAFPVDYNRVRVKLSKVKKNITVISLRQAHQFEQERPIFTTAPDHQLSILPQDVPHDVMMHHSGMQKNKEERKISDACNRSHDMMTPLMNVKESFMVFFQYRKEFYFHLRSPAGFYIGFIVVNQCLFDYQQSAPAMDLAFCFLDLNNSGHVSSAWSRIIKDQKCRDITVIDAEEEILKSTLFHFAKRTYGSCQSAGSTSKYQVLVQNHIDEYFTRAVIYLLYSDPDLQGLDMTNQANIPPFTAEMVHTAKEAPPSDDPAVDKKCSYCGSYSADTRKCTRCKLVQYCSKDCQTKHWPTHSAHCKKSSNSAATTASPTAHRAAAKQCSHCNRVSSSLKKCVRCGEAQYCNKDCQEKHWPTHRKACKKPPDEHLSSKKSAAAGTACAFCGSCSTKLMTCGKCGKARYCSKDCQRQHWKEHKGTCK